MLIFYKIINHAFLLLYIYILTYCIYISINNKNNTTLYFFRSHDMNDGPKFVLTTNSSYEQFVESGRVKKEL